RAGQPSPVPCQPGYRSINHLLPPQFLVPFPGSSCWSLTNSIEQQSNVKRSHRMTAETSPHFGKTSTKLKKIRGAQNETPARRFGFFFLLDIARSETARPFCESSRV